MFEELFEKIGQKYIKEKELIQDKDIYEAYFLLKNKNDEGALILKAIIEIICKKYDKAIKNLKILEQEEKQIIKDDKIYEFLGLCFYQTNNILSATTYFVKALEENEDNFYCRYNLTNILLKNGDYKKAFENLKILEKEEPENETIKKNLELVQKRL